MSDYSIELQVLSHGFDREKCWVHARPGYIPSDPPVAVVTMQKLRLSGDDVFYEINDMRSDDGGKTWSSQVAHADTLGRRRLDNGIEEGVCDFFPGWHAKTGLLLGTGHTCWYRNDELPPMPRPRSTVYSTYSVESGTWKPWKKLELPDKKRFLSEGAGSTQRLDLPNGEILLPSYVGVLGTVKDQFQMQYLSMVMRCSFDGETLKYLEHGTEMTVPEGRGFAEPSITTVKGRYFLTLRNNEAGYVAVSDDGLHYNEAPKPWLFDDGSDLGNYNTQQHWVTNGDDLYLVYTRRGANNDHIMRHRAPLFIAQVDTERLCVLRDTERVLVPERGARLCNFGVARVSDREVWVTVAEWMQTKLPDPFDFTICEKYGSDNSVYLAKIKFS